MLAAVDLDLTQSVEMAIGVQRQMEMNPITTVFAGMNDHLHSRVSSADSESLRQLKALYGQL